MPSKIGLLHDPVVSPARGFFTDETSSPHAGDNYRQPESKVVALWNALFNKAQRRRQHAPPPSLFDKNEVAFNETGVACLNNEHVVRIDATMSGANLKPIHAHRIDQQPNDLVRSEVRYAAGQSPPAESFKDFLAHAIESRQGLFEMVSRAAHFDVAQSSQKSLIRLLNTEIAAARDGNSELMFGDRYIFRNLTQIGGRGHAVGKDDFAQYELSVTDQLYGEEVTVPLTQAGLKFSDKVLQPKEIRRASALLDAHREAVQTCHGADQAEPLGEQLVLSRAGIGRNAAVITYRKMVSLIEKGPMDEAALDRALEEEIDAARIRRGAHYVHSVAQLESLRAALLDKLATVSKQSPRSHAGPPPHSRGAVAMRETLHRARPLSARNHTDHPTMSSPRSGVVSLLRERLTVATTLTANNRRTDAVSRSPIERAAHQIWEGIANYPVPGPDDEFGMPQNSFGTDLSVGFGLNEEVVSRTSATPNGMQTLATPGSAIQPTRYTNNDMDMAAANLFLCAPGIGMNYQRKLAADDGGSWWRAAFVAVLMEHSSRSPNATKDAAEKMAERVRSLGPEFTEEATVLARMMKQLTKKHHVQPADHHCAGIRGFMTDLQPLMVGEAFTATRPLFESGVSRLKAVDEDENDLSRPGETALKKIAHAMLLKAGFDEPTVNALFNADSQDEGSPMYIIALMNQLGAREGIIFTRPWVESEPGIAQPPWLDFKSATIDCYTMNKPLGPLCNVDTGVNQGDEVQKFVAAQANKPVIVAEHGHFSILLSHSEAHGWDYQH